MNHVQRRLPEVEISLHAVNEAIGALIHTILLARWPRQVRPRDVQCFHLDGLSYATCGDEMVDLRVQEACDQLLSSLEPAAPELHKGFLTVRLFKRRVNKVVFWSVEEKVTWEEWVIPMLVNSAPQPASDHRVPSHERRRLQGESDRRYAEGLTGRLMEVVSLLNESVEHVPPPGGSEDDAALDFEVSCAQRVDSAVFRSRSLAVPPVQAK
eukprot:CAMPEP_0172585670 /NCGR_PEP_ID=MMETSP1068-20121228/5072_1 /TAXON_ID=35684 /ORGANISM="Pseudopedinella elastica, Strain CCMP716" /LENGTH=210 /DNA_ID=CAMNT_0013380215 /DNA_START=120 /DNA_END=752 /DNA_ORIENTATION=-